MLLKKKLYHSLSSIQEFSRRINRIVNGILSSYHSVQSLLSSSSLSWSIEIMMNRTVVLPVVLYGCKNWSLTLRKVCKLSVFENRVLTRIFGPEREEVVGEWRRLHNEELYALYFLPNIIRMIASRILRWAEHVARIRERRDAYRV
jgi:hypothetical protein